MILPPPVQKISTLVADTIPSPTDFSHANLSTPAIASLVPSLKGMQEDDPMFVIPATRLLPLTRLLPEILEQQRAASQLGGLPSAGRVVLS